MSFIYVDPPWLMQVETSQVPTFLQFFVNVAYPSDGFEKADEVGLGEITPGTVIGGILRQDHYVR